MDFYCIYDLPNWLLFFLITTVVVCFSVGGQFIFAPFLKKLKVDHDQHNELISFYLAILGVFYGITLGLVAVATWETFDAVGTQVSEEAATLASLYRDISMYPAPKNDALKHQLKQYVHYIITEGWALQKQGEIPIKGSDLLTIFQKTLYDFNPLNNADLVKHQEAVKQFNRIIELRRLRIDSINEGLPALLWGVIVLGAILNISLCWLFIVINKKLHMFLNLTVGILIASLIFLIVALDNPYRGEFSIGPDSFELVYQNWMLR